MLALTGQMEWLSATLLLATYLTSRNDDALAHELLKAAEQASPDAEPKLEHEMDRDASPRLS